MSIYVWYTISVESFNAIKHNYLYHGDEGKCFFLLYKNIYQNLQGFANNKNVNRAVPVTPIFSQNVYNGRMGWIYVRCKMNEVKSWIFKTPQLLFACLSCIVSPPRQMFNWKVIFLKWVHCIYLYISYCIYFVYKLTSRIFWSWNIV